MLHPQAQALLRLIEERGLPPTHTLSPADARKLYRERRFFTQPEPPQVASVRDLEARGPAGPIPLRAYRPLGSEATEVLPVLVYFHGGGFVIGDLDTHDTLCRELSNLSGCAIVAVDYRLAPEQPYPAAPDDCLAATRWVRENAAALKVDPKRMAVGGDSAGGNLSAVVALEMRDAGDPPLALQLLIYPGIDQSCSTASHTSNGSGYLLTRETIGYFLGHYLQKSKDRQEWRASPNLAASHANLPPALVLVAGFDPLRDEGQAYAVQLSAAGTRATLVNFERQIHGFITMGRVLDEANAAVRMCAAEMRKALRG